MQCLALNHSVLGVSIVQSNELNHAVPGVSTVQKLGTAPCSTLVIHGAVLYWGLHCAVLGTATCSAWLIHVAVLVTAPFSTGGLHCSKLGDQSCSARYYTMQYWESPLCIAGYWKNWWFPWCKAGTTLCSIWLIHGAVLGTAPCTIGGRNCAKQNTKPCSAGGF